MHAAGTGNGNEFDFSGLTVPERIALAQSLWESVRDEVERQPLTETEVAEIRWRLDSIDAGLMVCDSFDVVMARAARG
jgi:putative addiction module component (TIGR02574 family)